MEYGNRIKSGENCQRWYPCQTTPIRWKEDYLLKVLSAGNKDAITLVQGPNRDCSYVVKVETHLVIGRSRCYIFPAIPAADV